MRKTKLKILSILILTSLLTFMSCNDDDLHNHNKEGKVGINYRKITFNEFKRHTKAFNVVAEVNRKQRETNNTLNKIVKDTLNNFTIDTREGLYLEYVNLHSFTFPIHREEDNGKLENLVLSYQNDGSYKVKILQYNLTPQEKADLEFGQLKNIQNPIVTIPLENFDTNLVVNACETYTETIWVSCSENRHNQSNFGSWGECTAAHPPRVYTVTKIRCIDAGDSTGGGEPIDDGFGSDPIPGGGGGPSDNNFPSDYPTPETNPEEYEEGISAPIKKPQLSGSVPELTPCDRVKHVTNHTADLKTKLNEFKSTTVLNLNHEKGFNFIENNNGGSSNLVQNDGNANTTSITVIIPEDGSMTGLTHTHFDRPDMLPTFTFEDLMTFNSIYQWRKYNNKSIINLTMMVVTRAGIFAMVIEGESTFNTNGYNLWTDQNTQLYNDFYKNILGRQNLTDEDVIIEITKGLENYGIGLYQANSDLSNWNKITVDADNNKVSTPCN